MWLVILMTYNLPLWLCVKESSFMLTLLIHGPKSSGKDIDVYLRPLIEDLKVLWDRKGVETIDVASGQKFNMRAMVLWTINDFPARSSLSGWSGQGVKLPDGFGSCFKHKVTDNDTNITGLKSHDCHIMMQRLLPYGLQNYLPDKIAKPIIELCSLFKQIYSATLMEDDMLKAQIKVVDILCDLELIYPPALFDIMIHLVIHLPLEDLEGGPIRHRWMYPFERYMKKLKVYVRNKAKPEGSIAEGYVVEEALTFSSHYFRDVTTKFNRLGHNVDPHLPTCQFQVDVPLDIIIDVVDEDDDITDDEDVLPHDLAESDNEDLINVDDDGPVPIQFELRDKQTVMPLGDHMAHWSSYIEEVIRGVPLYYPSWLKVLKERKASLITNIEHLQKAYNINKAAFKAQHWVIDPATRTYNVEKIMRERPENITASEWDKYIEFWNDPRNIARAAQNRQNRAKSTIISRQGSRLLARLRDEMADLNHSEVPALIDTFFVAHTVNGEFLRDEDQRIYFELGGASESGGCEDEEEGADHQDDEDENGDGDT
nr:hypothetical protein [Tanacetum cinerariifolium]